MTDIHHFVSGNNRLIEYPNFVQDTTALRQQLESISIVEDDRWSETVLPKDIQQTIIGTKTPANGPRLFHHPCIVFRGHVCRSRRSVGFFSDVVRGYTYSGQTMPSQPLLPWMRSLMEQVNQKLGFHFNAILINYYVDGNEEIAPHADNERDLDTSKVAAISVGAERKFVVTVTGSKPRNVVASVRTVEGSLLVMEGEKFQKLFEHHIPKEKRISESRFSLTFRAFR
jgi:alkylated DNA repair dioxygenase AlkB